MFRSTLIITLTLACAITRLVLASDNPDSQQPAAGVVSHIKILSDKVEDVSSMDAWMKSFIKEGMSGEQKGLAVWQSVVKFRHQDPPPNEFLTGDGGDVHDPIKTFNVYGYGMCCCESSNMSALARYAGLKARGWGINGHSVPDIGWDDSWHLMDASLVCYFKKPDGKIAGVEDILANVSDWYAKNPAYVRNNDKLVKFMGAGGWRKGPEVLANTAAYDVNGWLPAATHGWYSTMQEYDGRGGGAGGKAFLYEYGYSQGYQVNVQLRQGERLTRNWSNKGLHVNMDGSGGEPGCLKEKVGQGQLKYSVAYGDLAPGRIGNGTAEYDVPLASGAFRSGALSAENLVSKSEDAAGPALHVKDAANPGILIIRMPSSYVYLGGEIDYKAVLGEGGEVALAFSDNNGLDWKEISKVTASGEQKVDLKALIYRRYDYRLKVTLKGKGTGLDALKMTSDIQHSQRPLPALTKGKNTIAFSAGAAEGTVTVESSTNPLNKAKQLIYSDFHPVIDGLEDSLLRVKGNSGSVTFPIATPGDMTRIRFGCFYRARDAKDGWEMQVSFDGGKTFKTVGLASGPTGFGACQYVTFSDIPPGTKDAQVRWAGTQRNTTMISNFRIDADYKEPHGAFQPVKVTYLWDEGGTEKKDVHVASKPEESYEINCEQKPVMKSLVVELAGGK